MCILPRDGVEVDEQDCGGEREAWDVERNVAAILYWRPREIIGVALLEVIDRTGRTDEHQQVCSKREECQCVKVGDCRLG